MQIKTKNKHYHKCILTDTNRHTLTHTHANTHTPTYAHTRTNTPMDGNKKLEKLCAICILHQTIKSSVSCYQLKPHIFIQLVYLNFGMCIIQRLHVFVSIELSPYYPPAAFLRFPYKNVTFRVFLFFFFFLFESVCLSRGKGTFGK